MTDTTTPRAASEVSGLELVPRLHLYVDFEDPANPTIGVASTVFAEHDVTLELLRGALAARSFPDFDRVATRWAIALSKGDRLAAASFMGVGKSTLYRKAKRYGLTDPPLASPALAAEGGAS